MKSFIIAAAALAAAAGGAAAETLKTEIPFAFRAGIGSLTPGSYEVRVASDGIVFLHNNDTGKSALAMPVASEEPGKAWAGSETPRMLFECSAASCALLALWTAGGNPALRFPGLKSKGADLRIAMVPLRIVSR